MSRNWAQEEEFRRLREELEETKRQLHKRSHNPVSGLPNAHPFHDDLFGVISQQLQDPRAQEIMRGVSPAQLRLLAEQALSVILLIIDVGYLKYWNDKYSKALGNEVLNGFGQALTSHILPVGGKIYHWGGDEFAVLMVGSQAEVTRAIKAAIQEFRGRQFVRDSFLKPDADFGAVTLVEALHAFSHILQNQPKAVSRENGHLNIIMAFMKDIADRRCHMNKTRDRILFLREVWRQQAEEYPKIAGTLMQRLDFLPEDIEPILTTNDPHELYDLVQGLTIASYRKEIVDLDRRIMALEHLDGDEAFIARAGILAALTQMDFGPQPR